MASTQQTDVPSRGKYVEFGGQLKKLFPQAQNWVSLNHGSYGTMPLEIKQKMRDYQDMSEAAPDKFIRYDVGILLDESREAVAKIVNAPTDSVVFVGNATEAVNTMFRNMTWNEDGKDVIVFFSTIYPACAKIADYMVDYFGPSRVGIREIALNYPLEDEEIIQRFREAVADI